MRHYIIGDTTHGDNRQNNFFSSQFQLENMLLHAWELTFSQPFSKESITIKADLPLHFLSIMREFNWPEKELSNHLV